jgi:2'-5' RNA ligase
MAEHVGLFIPLPRYLARQYPSQGREGEDESPPHLTFCYIGDFDDDKKDELVATAKRIAQAIPPLELELKPLATFQNPEGQTILHNPVAGRNLHEAHYATRKALERRGFEPDDKFPRYKPHVTIEYVDQGDEPKLGKLNPTGRWRADAVELWGLGDPIPIPLGPQRTDVHASMKQMTISALLAAGRVKLANAIAYQV